MARPRWITSVMAALASTGLALSQQPASPMPAPNDQVGTVITVQEANRPTQKCIVIKSWTTNEGAKAHLVKALNSGESITIVEAGPASMPPPGDMSGSSRSVATRIFHWGRNNTPPSGTPMPPDAVSIACTPCETAVPAKTVTACVPCETPAPSIAKIEPLKTKTEHVKKSYLPSFLTKKTETPSVETKQANPASAETAQTKPAAFTTDDAKTLPPVKTASIPAKTDQSDDGHKPWVKPLFAKNADDDKKVAKDELPKVDKKKPDPLKLPEKPAELPSAANVARLPAAAPAKDSNLVPEFRQMLPPPPQAPQPNQRLASGAAVDHNIPPNGFTPPEQYATYAENNPSDRMINTFTPVNPAPAAGGPGILAQGNGPRGMMTQVAGRPGPMPALPYNGPSQLAYAAGSRSWQQPMAVMQAGAQVPAGYPSGTAVVPATWQQPVMAPQNAVPQPSAGMHQDMQNMLLTLKDSVYPSQREVAAEHLAKVDPRMQPHVVSALAKACAEDPAATVRAACVRCLVKMMNARGPEVTAAVQAAKADKDPRVQHEAAEALKMLAPGK